MEITNANKMNYSKLRSYFDQDSEYLNILFPLLKMLGWQEDMPTLIKALPYYAEKLTLVEFRNLMANLDYCSEKHLFNLKDIPARFTPCVFIARHQEVFLVTEVEGSKVTAINAASMTKTVITNTDIPGTLFFFYRMEVVDQQIKDQNWFFHCFLNGFKWIVLHIFIITLVYNLFAVAVPIFIMNVYDKVIPSNSVGMLLSFAVGGIILILAMHYVNIFRNKMVAYISVRLDRSVGYVIIKQILKLPAAYTENATPSSQIARIKDFDNIKEFFATPIAMLACELPLSLVFLVAIAWLGGWLALVPVILAVLFFVIFSLSNTMIAESVKKQGFYGTMKQAFVLESFSNMRDIKAIGGIDRWKSRFTEITSDIAKYNFKIMTLNHILSAVSDLLMMFAALTILGFGAYFALNDDLSAGALIAVMLLTWKILNPIKTFFSSMATIDQIKGSIKQVNNLINLPVERQGPDVAKVASVFKIDFQRVSFKYPGQETPSLLGVTFTAIPGTITCITGKNSSGKSTVLKLMLGLYHAQAGIIKINDININQFDHIELRNSIAYMSQEVKIFFGTIKKNLLLANSTATDQEIEIAARMAGIHEAIMDLPDQYNYKISDQSDYIFSNSFKQRLMLARTFLKQSDTLLLDEPGANLDHETDKQLVDTLNILKKRNTIIMVTNRPSHLKIADHLIYLQNGQAVLNGSKKETLGKILDKYAKEGKPIKQ